MDLPVIPKHLRADILRAHATTAGHLGFAKTYDRIRRNFTAGDVYRNNALVCHALSGVPKEKFRSSTTIPGRLVPIHSAIMDFLSIALEFISLGDFKVCSWKQMDNSLHGLLNTICNNKSLADNRSRQRNSEGSYLKKLSSGMELLE
ncbi:hypothetical protein TNCV_593621 [Trichonephila clavipes]|nr:hypothetical protein TNCV_593621 [Trichonephila clavipes]